uniref:outer membrane protein assembly factor BamE domain-containing protein n=1 Tax=Cupriavidus taiwanensis TaxID=164546 RepID=UPI003F49480E
MNKQTYAGELFVKKSILAVALAMSAALAGCTTTGANNAITDQSKVAMIKPGVTTTKDVERIFGRPSNVQYLEKGEQVWSYQNVSTGALAYIPFANMMGNSMKESTLVFRFTGKGVVKEFQQAENRL